MYESYLYELSNDQLLTLKSIVILPKKIDFAGHTGAAVCSVSNKTSTKEEEYFHLKDPRVRVEDV